MGPLTRNLVCGTQLHVLKSPLYELSVKASTCTESFAIVAWSWANELAANNNAMADASKTNVSGRVSVRTSFLIKKHLLVRLSFFVREFERRVYTGGYSLLRAFVSLRRFFYAVSAHPGSLAVL